jgi:hypothetical protein
MIIDFKLEDSTICLYYITGIVVRVKKDDKTGYVFSRTIRGENNVIDVSYNRENKGVYLGKSEGGNEIVIDVSKNHVTTRDGFSGQVDNLSNDIAFEIKNNEDISTILENVKNKI